MNMTGTDGSRGTEVGERELESAIPPKASAREARVGAFVLVGVLAVVTALYVLTDPAWFRGRYLVSTTVEDVGGMRVGDPVQMQGVNIGRVHGYLFDDRGDVLVTLEVEGEFEIPEGSTSSLVSSGLLQGRVVRIEPGAGPGVLRAGANIPGETQPDIMASVSDLGPQAQRVLAQVESILSDPFITSTHEGVAELRGLLAELRGIAESQKDEIAELTATLGRSAENLEKGLGDLSEATPDAARMIARGDSLMVNLNDTSDSLTAVVNRLDSILIRLDRGEGTLGLMLQDEALYNNLSGAAASIDSLLTDIRLHPERFVRFSIF